MESYKTKIYNQIYEKLINNTESFQLITKKFIKNINTFPMIYLSISNSDKVNLSNGVQADIITYEMYVLANNPSENFEQGGNEILLDLTKEIEYALAKPENWDNNHLGLPGYVIDAYFTSENFYDDESSGSGLISTVLTFTVVSNGESMLRPYEDDPMYD